MHYLISTPIHIYIHYVGVRGKYLAIGDRAQAQEFSGGAYFVGKLAWAKGLDLLFDHMQFVKQRCRVVWCGVVLSDVMR